VSAREDWGLTFATLQQVRVARAHGIQRVLYANQLTRPEDVRYVRDELEPDFTTGSTS
jgi:D-serine deaminase-like pyridoxal phosphate-dependent protein